MRFLRKLFHLPEANKPQKTAEKRQSAHNVHTEQGNQIDDAELDDIISMVTSLTGIIPRSSHLDGIRAYIKKRIVELGLTAASYKLRLQTDEKLFKELVNEATVNETYFFREAKQFKLLRMDKDPRERAASYMERGLFKGRRSVFPCACGKGGGNTRASYGERHKHRCAFEMQRRRVSGSFGKAGTWNGALFAAPWPLQAGGRFLPL